MMLVDTLLKKREKNNNPIKVGVVGAGEMGKGLINQIKRHTPGMAVSVVFSRNLNQSYECFEIAGIKDYRIVTNSIELEDAISLGVSAVTDNINLLL